MAPSSPMAASKQFPTILRLEQRESEFFEVQGDHSQKPYWFQLDYLKSPKAVLLEGWLVEAIFGECQAGRPGAVENAASSLRSPGQRRSSPTQRVQPGALSQSPHSLSPFPLQPPTP